MTLNKYGNIVEKWLNKIPHKFHVVMDKCQIMPNHIHMIINIISDDGLIQNLYSGQTQGSAPTSTPPTTIGTIIQWFKTMVTNEYIQNVHNKNWKPFEGRLFQRNYYEHIIRSDNDLCKTREYIMNNPALWYRDRNNPEKTNNNILLQ